MSEQTQIGMLRELVKHLRRAARYIDGDGKVELDTSARLLNEAITELKELRLEKKRREAL